MQGVVCPNDVFALPGCQIPMISRSWILAIVAANSCFLAMLAAWLYGWQCWSVSSFATLIQTEVFQQLLDGFDMNLCSDILIPQVMNVSDFDRPLTFLQHHHEVHSSFVVLSEVSDKY